MTESLSDYAEANVPAARQKHPEGWEPSVTWNGKKGVLSTGPLDSAPDAAIWDVLIKDWGLDPTTTSIVDGSVQVRAWDANLGKGNIQRMFYYRATLEASVSAADRIDIDALLEKIGKKKPFKKGLITSDEFDAHLVVPLSDWQIGKGEGGGSPAAIARIERGIYELVEWILLQRKMGKPFDTVVAVGLGDMIENCDGHYAMQAFTVDLDRRAQKKAVRRLLLLLVDELLKIGVRVILGAVPGNHGENRRNSKAFTTLQDNDDLAVFEEISEVFAGNPERYANVFIPLGAIADDLTMTLDVAGVPVAFAHGHQMRSGNGAQVKIENWWRGQALGRQRVSDAQILITGHLHHFVISEATGRTVIQCPAMDGGSQWWTGTSGQSSPAGMLVFGVGTYYGERGWGDLQILSSGDRA